MKKRKDEDVFDIVSKRKRDILARQKTVDNREKKAAELVKKMKDPIFREEYKTKKIQAESYGNPELRRKVLARGEKSGLSLKDGEHLDRKQFNNLRKRQFIEATTNPKYHCPCCGECKTKMSEWFISPKVSLGNIKFDLRMNRMPQRKVMCRSCVQAFGWDYEKPAAPMPVLFTSIIHYYKIDAIDLGRKRATVSKTIQQFAGLVGWNSSYQYRLENGGILKLNEEAMGDLVAAFSRAGIEIPLDVWGKVKERYVPDGKAIEAIRIHRGMSRRAFARKAGWSATYQRKIESGKEKTVRKSTMDVILVILSPILSHPLRRPTNQLV